MTRNLHITLSDQEDANIYGWVNYYIAHPNEVPTRLVLEERTQARLNEIAAQYGVVPAPVPTPVPTPVPVPVAGRDALPFPPSMSQNPPSNKGKEVQWHQEFRLLDPIGDNAKLWEQCNLSWGSEFANSEMTRKAELNFNWLMETYGSSYAYAYGVFLNTPGIINFMKTGLDQAYGDSEGARVINTTSGAGAPYPPAGYKYWWSPSANTQTLIIPQSRSNGPEKVIWLPYPIATGGTPGGSLGTPTPRLP